MFRGIPTSLLAVLIAGVLILGVTAYMEGMYIPPMPTSNSQPLLEVHYILHQY
jgi:hypothetical protein